MIKPTLIKAIKRQGWHVSKLVIAAEGFVPARRGYILTKSYAGKTVEVFLVKQKNSLYDIEDKAIKYKFKNRQSHFIYAKSEKRFAYNKQAMAGFKKMCVRTGLDELLVESLRLRTNMNRKNVNKGERFAELAAINSGNVWHREE